MRVLIGDQITHAEMDAAPPGSILVYLVGKNTRNPITCMKQVQPQGGPHANEWAFLCMTIGRTVNVQERANPRVLLRRDDIPLALFIEERS